MEVNVPFPACCDPTELVTMLWKEAMVSERSLCSKAFGATLQIPPGTIIKADDESGLTVHDVDNNLQWSFKYFDNLHMDLGTTAPARQHLHDAIERIGKAIFEEQFGQTGATHSNQLLRTQENPKWTPIIDTSCHEIQSESGSSTTALLVLHRTGNAPNQEIVMGRLFVPVKLGLFEVIVIAADGDKENKENVNVDGKGGNENGTTSGLAKKTDEQQSTSVPSKDHKIQQSTCLDRIRKATTWLLEESNLVVVEIPKPLPAAGSEMELTKLRCRIVPPPRFVYCPNINNPESNKQRFCRASFGGTDGVEMMVVTCWYGKNFRKGAKALRQVALHGAKVIHESQSFVNLRISVNELRLRGNTRRWIPSLNRKAIITTVNCEEAQGIKRQNTIGWIREPHSGVIYLVYFVDTLVLDPPSVQAELLATLSSIKVTRSNATRLGAKSAWHTQQHEEYNLERHRESITTSFRIPSG